MSSGSVTDGTVSQSEAQSAAIWRVREGVTEALVKRGEARQAQAVRSRGRGGALGGPAYVSINKAVSPQLIIGLYCCP